jgi:hypothetical protein
LAKGSRLWMCGGTVRQRRIGVRLFIEQRSVDLQASPDARERGERRWTNRM